MLIVIGAKKSFVIKDRYSVLGIPQPEPGMACVRCEGVGYHPIKAEDTNPVELERWATAHNSPTAHTTNRCDGWHIIECLACEGTGRRGRK